RLLLVLNDPESIGMSVAEKCRRAGISRQTYYATMQKPEFIKFSRDFAMQNLRSQAAPLVQALVKYAEKGSPLHMKMAMEMLGLHVDRRQVDANVTNRNIVITFTGGDGDEPRGSGEVIDVEGRAKG